MIETKKTVIIDPTSTLKADVVQSTDDPSKYGLVALNPDGSSIGGGGTPGGSDRQLQINDAGSFGGMNRTAPTADTLFAPSISDPSSPLEGWIWRNSDRLKLRTSTGSEEIAFLSDITTPSLTQNYIGFGDSNNELTGDAKLQYEPTTGTMTVGSTIIGASDNGGDLILGGNSGELMLFDNSTSRVMIRQGVGFSDSATAMLHITGEGATDATFSLYIEDANQDPLLTLNDAGYFEHYRDGGNIFFAAYPGSSTPYLYYEGGFGITNAAEDPQCSICIKGENAFTSRMGARYFGDSEIGGRYIVGRARGSLASPTTLLNENILGEFGFVGYDGGSANNGFAESAWVRAYTTEDWTDTDNGTEIQIANTPNGSTTKNITAFSQSLGTPGQAVVVSSVSGNKQKLGYADVETVRTPPAFANNLQIPAGVLGSGIRPSTTHQTTAGDGMTWIIRTELRDPTNNPASQELYVPFGTVPLNINPGSADMAAGRCLYIIRTVSSSLNLLYQQNAGNVQNNTTYTGYSGGGKVCFALVFDFAETNEIRMYLNGALVDSRNFTIDSAEPLLNANPLMIGQVPRHDGSSSNFLPRPFPTKEIAYFSKAFKLADAVSAYNSGTPVDLRNHAQAAYLRRRRRPEGSDRPVLRDWTESGHDIIITSPDNTATGWVAWP